MRPESIIPVAFMEQSERKENGTVQGTLFSGHTAHLAVAGVAGPTVQPCTSRHNKDRWGADDLGGRLRLFTPTVEVSC